MKRTVPGNERMIDRWFPCEAVDSASRTPVGSAKNEKAIFPWFASRPIAQARAAVLTALAPDEADLRPLVVAAVRSGDRRSMEVLESRILQHHGRAPVVLDPFSGRGIIPLEASRAGATSVGLDLSPVATLAGRLLADWPMRDWSSEPVSPFVKEQVGVLSESGPRLLRDVRALHSEIGRRAEAVLSKHYPKNTYGTYPWGYLWAVTIPCDGCKRRFPLLGNLVLRHPYNRANDEGQALRIDTVGDDWSAVVHSGLPQHEPSYSAAEGRKGKSARCPFPSCRHVHSLEAVKRKGDAGQYEDVPLAVCDHVDDKKVFRLLSVEEREAALGVSPALLPMADDAVVPDEPIPAGNVHTVQASGYGYKTFGDLMVPRQAFQFAVFAQVIRECHQELVSAGLSADYAAAQTSLACATFVRRLKYSTRGAGLQANGRASGTETNWAAVKHIFTNEAGITFQFDYFETGIGDGPGTWFGLTKTGLKPYESHLNGRKGRPVRIRRGNAMALPFRDGTIDAIITDPPYYDMIEYADASDFFYVWLKRILWDTQPDLFESGRRLQDKENEIIVRRVYNGGVRHDKQFYEKSLERAFLESRRVLRPDGHLVVVFGHKDPDAWKRLLGALHDAGFIVTSSWPSRTESANTGVASIKVTVTIGCRVALANRPVATADQVDGEVAQAVRLMVPEWERDGLALQDQMMAAYGPAMAVYGRYGIILRPDGSSATLESYLLLARRAVRDATALKLDQMPLETFDPATRVAVFCLRAYGRTEVSKGEAIFLAQLDGLRIEELRDRILKESRSGFRLLTDAPKLVTPESSTFEVVRALAEAWKDGGTEAAGSVFVAADKLPNDEHVWAVVGELVNQLPAADEVSKSLTSVQRNREALAAYVSRCGAATLM